ncbi:MAG: AbrB family transcriptional regulator [Candidatus Korarchaeota archaeon]|nr:AbrB family transcriptional regulator [Candidatus Korarchaeota archaeon]
MEVRRVDRQGRLVLPPDWRESELGDSREVLVIKGRGYLKLIPRRGRDLTRLFDSVALGVESIVEWAELEAELSGGRGAT